MSEPIAILKSYSPSTGAVVASTTLHADGQAVVRGDESLARFHLRRLQVLGVITVKRYEEGGDQ